VDKKKKINIFIIDDSFNNEENIVKLMRSSGYAAHTTRIEDDEDLIAELKKKSPDILLYSSGMALISLADTMKCLEENASLPVPVLAVNRPGNELNVIEVMRTGAKDLTSYDNPSHLEMVIHREVEANTSISKLFKLEQSVKETEKRCEALLDSSRDAIAYIHEGMHVYSNHSYLELFGFDESEDLEGMPILDMVGTDERESFKSFLRGNSKSKNNASEKLELSLSKPDGSEFKGEMEFSSASIDGEPCTQVIIRIQSHNKDLEKQLALMSQTDSVTGLFNRQFFLDSLENSASKAKDGELTAATLLIHLDNFNDIKQTAGVVGADQFLNEISRKFEESVTNEDLLAHFEGNTFSIIAYNQTIDTVTDYARKVSKNAHDFIANINNQSLNTTCTIGISLLDRNTPDTGEILLRAERAIGQATEKGPNSIIVYKPKEGELTQKEIDAKVINNLKDALKNNRFVLYYQPVISLHGDTDERYEVFVRMLDKKDNIILPAEFLPAADRTGMSVAIDHWVLLNTIKTVTKCWKEGKRTLFFVKLAGNSLKDATLMTWLKEQLKKYNVPKNSLIFEVKENVAVTSLKYTSEIAKSLQELNCGFALDDFGSGNNPFELLKHIPADYLKLERSFMDELSSSTENQEAVKAITDKAMEMNKLTIAQCVQDATSLSVLWGMGINFIQGNFLQEPSPNLDYDFTSMAG
jgi:multidomain signaling protein FimX